MRIIKNRGTGLKRLASRKRNQGQHIGYYITTNLQNNKIEIMPVRGKSLVFYGKEEAEFFIKNLETHIRKNIL